MLFKKKKKKKEEEEKEKEKRQVFKLYISFISNINDKRW